jgi:hypothetical protein
MKSKLSKFSEELQHVLRNYLSAIIAILLTCTLTTISFAQNEKTVPPNVSYYAISPDGNYRNAILTTEPQPPQSVMSDEEKQLLHQLQEARSSNNISAAQQLQNRLNIMHGVNTHPIQEIQTQEVHGEVIMKPVGSEGDYNAIQIHNSAIKSNAVATVPAGYPNAGRIWVVSTKDAGSGAADTLKYYYSDNGGSSWIWAYEAWYGYEYHFLPDDIQIVVCNDGNGNIWLWTVAAVIDVVPNAKRCVWLRFNATTFTSVSGNYLSFPGIGTTTNRYYSARIATDNSVYTTATYVYMICSFDSTYSGGRWLRQKVAVCTNPFAAAPIVGYQQISNGGFFWNQPGVPAGVMLYSDIGYYRDNAANRDRIMTVYGNSYTTNNVLIAWSDNYGLTLAGQFILGEASLNTGVRIAFNGGIGNMSGMITYTRQFSGTDWDPYYRNTTTGGTTPSAWAFGGFIDGSFNRCRSTDIVAIRGAANLFKSAYAQDNPSAPSVYYSSFNGVSWSAPLVVNNLPPDTTFAKPRADYTTGSDNCLSIWSSYVGAGTYVSILCGSTVGISGNNTGIPKSYALAQNYPNPFNPSTSIKFNIPVKGFVKLIVFDITGREIAQLVNKDMNAGSYEYTFDASNIASGVYFYKITANDFVDTKKMILVK